MTTALRSVLTGGVAVASAAVVAVTPLAPTVDLQVPRLVSADVALADFPTPPPLGAIGYQALVNGIADVVALAPIVFGSTAQCTVCIGPVSPPSPAAIPFTGWGLVGAVTGLITAPVALVQTLLAGQGVGPALGAAVLALQTPITNTFQLLALPRQPVGGFELQGVLDRAFAATKATVDAILNITAQALVSGPLDVLGGVVTGAQLFAGTLASTGDIGAAVNAGLVPIQAAVTGSVTDLVTEVGKNRTIINNILKTGPGKVTAPIPTVPLPPVAAVRAAASLPAVRAESAVPAREDAPVTAARKSGRTAAAAATGTTRANAGAAVKAGAAKRAR